MGRINPKTGQPYRKGATSPIHDEQYTVTIIDAIRAINADPDLQTDDVAKANLIKKIFAFKGQALTDYLNQIYKRAYGVDANTTTPLAKWAQEIAERRNREKLR